MQGNRAATNLRRVYRWAMVTKGGAVLVAVGWLFAGLLIWAIGVFGIARGLEDRCLVLADERGYGGSTQSSSILPPRFTCELAAADGTSGTVEVGQPGVALLRSGWVLGFPIVWVVLGAGIRLRQNSREEFLPSR